MTTNELIAILRDEDDPNVLDYIDDAADQLEAQQTRITELEAELEEERYRHDRVQDFEVAEAQVLAKLREERRWIPVEERLPGRDGQYLCRYCFGQGYGMTFVQVLDYYATDEVLHFQHTLGDTTMRVTHWMPLSEPPKEVG